MGTHDPPYPDPGSTAAVHGGAASAGRGPPPVARVVERAALGGALAGAMYRLYTRHYDDCDEALFRRDLAAKTHVVLLTDATGVLRGFSTIERYTATLRTGTVQVLFSGDTLVEPAHWGSPALALGWLRFAGEVRRAAPGTPLYWLLIVKGHRTYRFLPAFARRYLPDHRRAPSAALLAVRDALARAKFGACFDPVSGVLRFDEPRGRLRAALADVPARHLRLPGVRYFLERNPGYREGDELVCLCELEPDNLRALARRVFAPAGSAG